jgi:hypothetical protein
MLLACGLSLVGCRDPSTSPAVQSTLTGADLPPNAFLPWMDTRPDGAVYVIVEGLRIGRAMCAYRREHCSVESEV